MLEIRSSHINNGTNKLNKLNTIWLGIIFKYYIQVEEMSNFAIWANRKARENN